MNNNDLFEKVPISKAYFKLSLPVVLSMVISLVYNMVDTFFVAQTQNTNLVAGVSLCAPIFTLMIALGDIFSIGGSSVISRLFGQKQDEEGKNVSDFCFYGAIVCGILVSLIMMIARKPILTILGTNQATLPYASQYYTYMALGATLIIVSLTPSNLMRTEGLATESMIGTITGSIINMILDPIFILYLNMGAGGAAIATIIGYFASDLVFIYLTLKKSKKLSISLKHTHITKNEVISIFTIGIPASITNLMSSFAMAMTNNYLVTYGNDKVAAMGIVLKINMIVLLVMIGFAFGAQPLLGYNYGAHNTKRLKEIIKFDLFVEITFAVITSIILALFTSSFIKIFMNDPSIIQAGTLMLRFLLLSSPCVGIILVFTTLFQSEGKALPALLLSIGRQGIVFAIFLLLLSNIFGYYGIISSQMIADIITAIIALILYKIYK
ncbi:MATE family efflux transporter [Faecalibacillus intestinalis]|uniref:MATE family efflux transporter n=1 Tax=Faecalibacillus intestinalis TaxID=1982626 RepID=UPI0039907E4E